MQNSKQSTKEYGMQNAKHTTQNTNTTLHKTQQTTNHNKIQNRKDHKTKNT